MVRVPATSLALLLFVAALAPGAGPALANAAYDAGMSALSSTFSPKPGSPSGSYACTTIDVMHTTRTIVMGTMVVTPGHYSASGYKWAAGTWSGSGDHLKFSGQPFNTAQAQYGANRAGRGSMRFIWNPTSQRSVWICTR
jgi:hypothetical protein